MNPYVLTCSMFAKQLLLFLPNLLGLAQDLLSCLLPSAAALCLLSSCCFFLPNLPSPLLCFADDEIVQVHTLYGIWADDQELVRNLTSYQPPLLSFSICSLFFIYAHCIYDAFMLQVLYQMTIDMFLRPLPLLLLLLLVLWISLNLIDGYFLRPLPLLLLLLLISEASTSTTTITPLLSCSSTITVFLDINLGEDMTELFSPDLPNNYVYDLSFQPALRRANHPYPSIVSNMF